MLNWQELIHNAPLGHKGRNKRAANLLQDLLQGHTANSHGVAGASLELDQTANQAAWRFLDNKHLKLPALYQPVHAALQQRIAVGQRAYILHDVSVSDYSRHDRKEDLCVVGDGRGYGYELFSSLVLDSAGKPLGCLGSELRTAHGLLSWQSSEILPFVDHLEQAERAVTAAAKILPGRQLVHVADREFDDLQLLTPVQAQSVPDSGATPIAEGTAGQAICLAPGGHRKGSACTGRYGQTSSRFYDKGVRTVPGRNQSHLRQKVAARSGQQGPEAAVRKAAPCTRSGYRTSEGGRGRLTLGAAHQPERPD